jgi:hypothetical protein
MPNVAEEITEMIIKLGSCNNVKWVQDSLHMNLCTSLSLSLGVIEAIGKT